MAKPVVFAFGPDTCFAGIAGDEAPKAEYSRKALDLAHGCEDLEKVLQHTFENELKTTPSDRKVLFIAPPVAGKCCREKIGKVLFEKFNVPALYLAMDCVLAGYASGKMNALVIEANEKGTFMVSVKDGHAVPGSIEKGLDLGNLEVVADRVEAAIAKFGADERDDIYKSVILTGINTLKEGLPEGLEAALQKKCASAKVCAPPHRKFSPWIGGSILASLGDFQKMWITKEDYEAKGIDIIHEKCSFQ